MQVLSAPLGSNPNPNKMISNSRTFAPKSPKRLDSKGRNAVFMINDALDVVVLLSESLTLKKHYCSLHLKFFLAGLPGGRGGYRQLPSYPPL